MKQLLVKVKDKAKVYILEEYCQVVYRSNFLNVIGIEIDEGNIYRLAKDANVISYKEAEEGQFQATTLSVS